VLTVLGGHRVIPVCGLSSPDEARKLGEALLAGGLPIVEVTLRSPNALECLTEMVKVEGLTVGAGTVRTATQLRDVENAGAAFAVSPCLTDDLAFAGRRARIPYLPGIATASELQTAHDAGFDAVKFFPAEANGGMRTLGALAEVFVDMCFVPTGGLTAETAATYLAHPQVAAVGGSWMLPREARERDDWAAVTEAIAACVGRISAA
jgi:2-dehydro-3-deoxyphosphogluconate aldolase/(4S)-4-hydroxy-2-oxoglutarate aldolase